MIIYNMIFLQIFTLIPLLFAKSIPTSNRPINLENDPEIHSLSTSFDVDISSFENRSQETNLYCFITLQIPNLRPEFLTNELFNNNLKILLVNSEGVELQQYSQLDELSQRQIPIYTPMNEAISPLILKIKLLSDYLEQNAIEDLFNSLKQTSAIIQKIVKIDSLIDSGSRVLGVTCGNGQFDNNGICSTCSSCSICASMTSYNAQRDCFLCLSKPPYSLTQRLDGTCQPSCPPGQSYSVWTMACTIGCDTSQCICKNSQCISCLNSTYTVYPDYNTCYLCDQTSTKVGSVCLKCNINQFVDLPNKKCTSCSNQYGSCDQCNENKCTQCSQSGCYDGFDRIKCITPSFGDQQIGDICFQQQSSCKSYSNASLREDKKQIVCDECVNSSYIKYADGSCNSSCTSKHDIFDGVCTSCMNNCLKCPNLVECTQCDNSLFIFNNSSCVIKTDCLKNAEYTANPTTKVCEKCQTNDGQYFLKGNCSKCHSSCQTCSGDQYNQCLSCHQGANLLLDNTCFTCALNDGYYLENNNCKKCDHTCKVCNGPADTDCQQCVNGFVQNKVTNKCECSIQNCVICSTDGLTCLQCKEGYIGNLCIECNATSEGKYIDNGNCKDCHSTCKSCSGPLQTDCTKCKIDAYQIDPSSKMCQCTLQSCKSCNTNGTACLECIDQYVLKDGACQICKTDSGYFLDKINQLCIKCHSSCATCNGPTEKDCISCSNPSFIKDPRNFNICTCPIQNCKQCSTDGKLCQQCYYKYVLNNSQNKCTYCDTQNSNYYNFGTDTCDQCNQACKTCFGKDQNQCNQCLYQGQTVNTNKQCSCPMSFCLICTEDPLTNQKQCSCQKCKCDVLNCSECFEADSTLCKSCQKDYDLTKEGKQCLKNWVCKVPTCKECEPFQENKCKICQAGYELSTLKDTCIEIMENLKEEKQSFVSKLEMNSSGFEVTLLFQKPIQIQSDRLKDVVEFSITDLKKDTDYKYEIEQKSDSEISISLELNQSCKQEMFIIQITDQNFVKENHLSKLEDKLPLSTYIKLTESQTTQKAEIETTSKTITSTILGTIIPLALLGNFYVVFSMLDITGLIYYLLYLDIRYPFNVLSFCDLFQNFQFAFIPNMLLNFLDPNYAQWAPQKFIENQSDGYFLHGAGQSFTIIIIIMSIYFGLKIISLIPIKVVSNYVKEKIKGGWEYSGFVDLIWTVYLYVLVSVLLQFYTFEIYDASSYINYILFVICAILIVAIPIKFTMILYNSKNIKDDSFLNERLSSLIGGLKLFNECEDKTKDDAVEKINETNKQENNEDLEQSRLEKKVCQIQDLPHQEQIKNIPKTNQFNQLKIASKQKDERNQVIPINEKEQQNQCKLIDLKSMIVGSAKSLDQIQQYSNFFASKNSLSVLIEKKSMREIYQIKLSKYTNVILYYRKIIYSCIIVYLHEYTYLQTALLSTLTLIVGCYYLYIRPHMSYFDNLKNGVSEFILIIIIISASILKNDPKEQSEDERIKIGWIFVICTAVIMLVQAVDLIIEMARSLLIKFISIFRKKTNKIIPLNDKRGSKIGEIVKPIDLQQNTKKINNKNIDIKRFAQSELSLKSNDKLEHYEVSNILNNCESPTKLRILQDSEQASPVKSIRKRRVFNSNKQLSIIPLTTQNQKNKNTTIIQSIDQDSNMFEAASNLQPISATRIYVEESTSRQFLNL